MKAIFLAVLALLSVLTSGCAPGRNDFDARLRDIAGPYLFSVARWELRAIPNELGQSFLRSPGQTESETQLVIDYFARMQRLRIVRSEIEQVRAGEREGDLASLEAELKQLEVQRKTSVGAVERIIEKQIRLVLDRQGIFSPFANIRTDFPPVNFKLETPPNVLIVSPRDRIESIREITLEPDLTIAQMEMLEDGVDALGVSSLVEGVGGLAATYPTLVDDEASLRFVLETSIHEWLHQYLAFTPLGFRYLLDLGGIVRDYDIATMNETVVGMVGRELAAILYEEYYNGHANGGSANETNGAGFDFNREMREIRRAVDAYLARGEIERAEQFMEERRQYLASNGYYIRKLNQAYFAFHGTYADSPTSISPIGAELRTLREQSVSLKGFLDTAAAMRSRQDLSDAVEGES